jgi:hypothetical protein
MDRNRLTTSVQLLPALIGDPFGTGWDLLGPAGPGLRLRPSGVTGLAVGQLAVLVVGHTTGRWSLREALDRPIGSPERWL